MTNPWTVNNPFDPLFGSGRYVLQGDSNFIQQYNQQHPGYLQLQLMPEPFIGDFCKSKLMILMGNPGYTPCLEDDWHNEKAFLNVIQSSWNHSQPFYYYSVDRNCINKKLTNKSLDWYFNPGNVYWHKILFQIRSNICLCPELVFEAELFPYHSQNFDSIENSLRSKKWWNAYINMPSTKYLKQLIDCAIACDKVIIIARAQKLYFELCKNLENYPRLYVLKSPQGAHFTAENIVNYKRFVNKESSSNDINILCNDIQNMPKCSQDCCEKMLNVLSQSN